MIGTVSFGPAVQNCERCKRLRRAALNTGMIALSMGALLADIVSDLAERRVSKRTAMAYIAIIVLLVAVVAFIWGRYDGVTMLARKLDDARRREHEEEDETAPDEEEGAEAATTSEEGEANA